ELRVAGLAERDDAVVDAVRLVLRAEPRRRTSGAVRRAEAEVAEPVLIPPRLFGYAPDTGHAAERSPAVAGAEQRAAVVAERAVEYVAILVVEARSGQRTH